MHFRFALLTVYTVSILSSSSIAVSSADSDISKGAVIIEPGSKEAQALHAVDKAPKFAPHDNNYAENFKKGSSFKKSEPKLSDQKIDVPDTDSLTPDNKEKAAATKDDKIPVVIDDYNPNNMGISSEKKAKAQGHTGKDSETGSKEPGGAGSINSEPASPKGTTLEEGTGIDPEEAAAAVAAGNAAKDSGAGPGGSASNFNKDISSESWNESPSSGIVQQISSYFRNIHSNELLDATETVSRQPFSEFCALAVSVFCTILYAFGDGTFLIAAILAMRHNRATIFSASVTALGLKGIVSGVVGPNLPKFLSPKTQTLVATLLFFFFGVTMLRQGVVMRRDAYIEKKLEKVETLFGPKTRAIDLELGLRYNEKTGCSKAAIKRSLRNPKVSDDESDFIEDPDSFHSSLAKRNHGRDASKSILEGLSNLVKLVISPIWVQTFTMTFFAECGGSSLVEAVEKVAGIDYLMVSGTVFGNLRFTRSSYWWVIIGVVVGNLICVGSAVGIGKFFATKTTLKKGTLTGALVFIVLTMIHFCKFISC